MKKQIIKLLKDFHSHKICLKELSNKLLSLDSNKMYKEWILNNIKSYEEGETHVFSLTSSGSISNSFDE
jgi:hypothetical protein